MADLTSVPNVAGVPPVLFAPGVETPALLAADAVNVLAAFGAPVWGIYLGGFPVIAADSTITFEFRKEYALSDYPLERGGFETFNKVEIPFDSRLRVISGGSLAKRAALLASIDAIIGDRNLYTIVTPEIVRLSANLRHYDYRQSAFNGIGLLEIEIWCEEVRIKGGIRLTTTQQPSGSPQENGGTVQPTEPTPDESILHKFFGGGGPAVS